MRLNKWQEFYVLAVAGLIGYHLGISMWVVGVLVGIGCMLFEKGDSNAA